MRSVALGVLGCVSSLVPSSMALNVPRSNYALAELLDIPNNLTIMTPHDTSSLLEHQFFDFGSPFSSGFSGLRHLAERQGCSAATEACHNDPTTCCQLGGDCCGDGICCKAGSFCYGGGCCLTTKVGCNNKASLGVVTQTRIAVQAEAVVRAGPTASPSMENLGAAQTDKHASASPSVIAQVIPLVRTKSSAAVPTGFVCSRDSANEPLCSDPNAHTATQQATSIPAPQPTTTHVEITQTIIAPTTDPLEPSQTSGFGTIFGQSTPKKNVGAIAGGTVTGVVVLVAMLAFLIMWRRKQPNGTTDSEVPTGGPAVTGPPEKDAYSPTTVPPTPGTVNPFLTPMNPHPNPEISYFPGPVDRPTSIGSSTHYTGLPEPQHGDDMGVAVGTTPMPVPRHDLHHPYPLPMTVTPLRDPSIDSGPTRVWSGFIPSPSPPAGQNIARGSGTTPIPSGWSCHGGTNTNSIYSNPPGANNAYGSTPPPGAPSTIYQPSEGERYTGHREPYSPPASPPPESLYPRTFATLGGLPSGAAPPVTNFASVEQTLE